MSADSLIDGGLDIFASELSRIDRIGCNRRLIFTLPTLEGGQWKSVQVKLIVPADYMAMLGALIAGDGAAIPRNSLALFSATGESH
jgi:hypothetical protein